MFPLNPASARRLAFLLFFLVFPALATDLPDLPPCETPVGAASPALSIGIVQPHAAPEVVRFAAGLAQGGANLAVCTESWREVLPRLVPWAGQLERGYGFAVFLLALFAAVALLARFTPREQWRRITLAGVLAVSALTWVLGVAVLAGFHALGGQRLAYGTVVTLRPAQQAEREWLDVGGARELEALLAQRGLRPEPRTAVAATPATAPSGSYRVFHRLNLREGPGIDSPRSAVLHVGESVTYDGAAQGDWWRIRTTTGATGWASSIWLRRPEEVVPAVAGNQG